MTNKDYVLSCLGKYGNEMAKKLQQNASNMTGTELYKSEVFIPDFDPKKQYLNFPIGYVCKSAEGRIVKLIQPYDSTIFTAQPEELPAQWGFYWSKDPNNALPFVALSTSPYMMGDCCVDNGVVYCSLINNNTWKPSDYPQGWEVIS